MAKFDFGTISTNITEARESPVLWLPGVDDYFTLQIDGAGTIASPTMVLYENGVDVSATKLSGTMTVTGRVIKSKTISSLAGGMNYVAYIFFTDDGVGTAREVSITCPKLGVKPSNYPLSLDRLRLDESPILIYPGQSFNSQIVIDGQGTIGASPTMYLYKSTSDDSANTLSGALAVSGRMITLKAIGSLSGGSEYIGYIYFTDGGKNTCRYFEVICPRLGVY